MLNIIFLFLNYSKTLSNENILYGIDLSTIPYEIREVILSRIWNEFADQISKNTDPKKTKAPLPLSPTNLDSASKMLFPISICAPLGPCFPVNPFINHWNEKEGSDEFVKINVELIDKKYFLISHLIYSNWISKSIF